MRDAFRWKINNIFCSLTLCFLVFLGEQEEQTISAWLGCRVFWYFHFPPGAGSGGVNSGLVSIRRVNPLGCGCVWARGVGEQGVWWLGGHRVWLCPAPEPRRGAWLRFGLSVPMLALDEHNSELHCHESVFPYLCASSLIGKHITS